MSSNEEICFRMDQRYGSIFRIIWYKCGESDALKLNDYQKDLECFEEILDMKLWTKVYGDIEANQKLAQESFRSLLGTMDSMMASLIKLQDEKETKKVKESLTESPLNNKDDFGWEALQESSFRHNIPLPEVESRYCGKLSLTRVLMQDFTELGNGFWKMTSDKQNCFRLEQLHASTFRLVWYKYDESENHELNCDLKDLKCFANVVDIEWLPKIVANTNANQQMQHDCFRSHLGIMDHERRMEHFLDWIPSKKIHINANPPITLTPYSTVIPKVIPFKRATSFGTSNPGIETYTMNGKNRGVLFLVNNIDFPTQKDRRNGAEMDKKRLLDLFNQMEFTIFYYENLKMIEFLSLMQQLSTSEQLRQGDCLFFGVLTHGNQ